MRPFPRATTLALATYVTIAACLVGCGASGTSSSNTNTPAARTTLAVERTALRITLGNGMVLALAEDGAITVDGQPFGTMHPDGRVVAPDGATLSALIPDGQISFRGEIAPVRIAGDRLSAEGEPGAIVIADPDRLQTRRGTGEIVQDVPVIGLTATNRPTLLFLVATVMLERMRDDADRGAADDDVEAADGGEGEEPEAVVLRVPVEGAPQRGPTDALVTVVIFSDFQCPFCSRVTPTLERVMETYGNDVRLVFRHNPLPFHPNAMVAAEASMEAFAQRGAVGFWQMHDLLFENQQALDRASLESYAAQLGLDVGRFRLALDGHVHQAAIDADMALAARIGARGTPTFFVNGRELVGAQPFEAFQDQIDGARRDAQARVARGVPRARLYDQILAQAREQAPPPPARPTPPPEPEDDPTRRWAIGDGSSSPARGPSTAPVTIQVFSDFQCPFCSRAVPTIERVMQTYGTRVRFVFRHYPLPFHVWAREAAELSVEIRRQRGDAGFWQFHDLVFENQRVVGEAPTSRQGLLDLASRVRGVNVRAAERALDQHTHEAAVDADMDAVRGSGASIGTPTFFINGRLLAGAQPFERFQAVIDEELAARP